MKKNKRDFYQLIKEARHGLHKSNKDAAYQIILHALMLNPNAPEPQNLLGIWYEQKNNADLARKHYRAAYALDPSYHPATSNIERMCSINMLEPRQIDYGDNEGEKEKKECIF